jgi:nicotinamidase-related amidase
MTLPASSPCDRALLLIVDMQSAFLATIPASDALVRRCCFALEAARNLGFPVAFTEQVPAKLGPTVPELLRLVPEPRVFAKDTFSALASPDVRALLAERATEHVVLAGIETPVCIYQTAIDALAVDLQVTLLTDCLGGRRAADCSVVVATLARLGCHALPSETVFYSILKTTTHPFFREYTKLVKRYQVAAEDKPVG